MAHGEPGQGRGWRGVRRAHLVGSIPAGSAEEAMRLAVKRLGPELEYLPDGETGVP
jgi:hypothetical protein